MVSSLAPSECWRMFRFNGIFCPSIRELQRLRHMVLHPSLRALKEAEKKDCDFIVSVRPLETETHEVFIATIRVLQEAVMKQSPQCLHQCKAHG